MRTNVLGLTGLMLSGLAYAGEFIYQVRNYPTQPAGCHETATKLGQDFEKATGIKATKSRCLDETKDGYLLEVAYRADKPLTLVSTSQVYGGTGSIGRYPTREKCEASTVDEGQIFRDETGLTPAFSVCVRDGISDEKWAWYPRIDAFGNATKRPQMAGYPFFGVPQGMTGVELRDKIFAAMKAKGIRPVGLIFRSHLVYGEATVHYYSADRLKFKLLEFTRNASVAHCQAQNAEVDALFANDHNGPLVHYCGKPVMGAASELNVLFVGDLNVDIRPSAERYKTQPECEAARPGLITYYQQTLKLPVRGGFCGMDPFENDYRVTLIEDHK